MFNQVHGPFVPFYMRKILHKVIINIQIHWSNFLQPSDFKTAKKSTLEEKKLFKNIYV